MKSKIFIFLTLFLVIVSAFYFSKGNLDDSPSEQQEDYSGLPGVQEDYSDKVSEEIVKTEPLLIVEDSKALNTQCFPSDDGDKCFELIDITYLEDGREWKHIYRWENGDTFEVTVNYKEGDNNGHNFDPESHEYWFYENNVLEQLSAQNDAFAQHMLSLKLYFDIKNLETNLESIKLHSMRAARNGRTAALVMLSQAYYDLGDKNNFYAYRLIWLEDAPEELKSETYGFENLSQEQQTEINKLVDEIKLELKECSVPLIDTSCVNSIES